MKAVKQSSERSCRLWVKRYSFAMSAFRSSFESGHSPTRRPRPFRADSVAKLLKFRATNFPRKDETSDNYREVEGSLVADLEEMLRARFPMDAVEPVTQG
jgi:hypothetical protein